MKKLDDDIRGFLSISAIVKDIIFEISRNLLEWFVPI